MTTHARPHPYAGRAAGQRRWEGRELWALWTRERGREKAGGLLDWTERDRVAGVGLL